ncbi:MAG: hypothetical protein JWQ48_1135 [Conexibacter sp.]|nr:hypothetical protein [Conexibacter sp.]
MSRGTVEALRTPHERFAGLPDLLQEDQGPLVGRLIADWLGTPRPEGFGSFENSPEARSRGPM